MKHIILSILTLQISIFANIGPQGFKKWVNPYFVETGTFGGESIQRALKEGYGEIHSLEIDWRLCKNAKKRFKNNDNVHIYHKDSGKELWSVIKKIDGPITFWLDGHNGTPDPQGGKNTPLLEELDQIKLHPYKGHTILIDDLHCCGRVLFDYITLDMIIRKIWEINPEYKFIFEEGGNEGEYKNNVLVAFIKNK